MGLNTKSMECQEGQEVQSQGSGLDSRIWIFRAELELTIERGQEKETRRLWSLDRRTSQE